MSRLRTCCRRAAELGVTVSELVAELATLESEPTAVEAEGLAELDRRSKKIEAGGARRRTSALCAGSARGARRGDLPFHAPLAVARAHDLPDGIAQETQATRSIETQGDRWRFRPPGRPRPDPPSRGDSRIVRSVPASRTPTESNVRQE